MHEPLCNTQLKRQTANVRDLHSRSWRQGATGLPVVSTRLAGIPDVVIDGETGFVVEEKDVAGMAERMLQLANDPELASRLGLAARKRISTEFTMAKSITNLYEILCMASKRHADRRSNHVNIAVSAKNGLSK